MEQLECEYDLLKTPKNTPVILVPKRYKVTQMPAHLEDIGNKWLELGDITLTKLFVSTFIRNKEIQRDLFHSLRLLTSRQGVDYAIILPDEETFLEVIRDLEEKVVISLSLQKFIPKEAVTLSCQALSRLPPEKNI